MKKERAAQKSQDFEANDLDEGEALWAQNEPAGRGNAFFIFSFQFCHVIAGMDLLGFELADERFIVLKARLSVDLRGSYCWMKLVRNATNQSCRHEC